MLRQRVVFQVVMEILQVMGGGGGRERERERERCFVAVEKVALQLVDLEVNYYSMYM